ncbi:MAG: hypothetical protein QNJ88_04595 [Acidimicrobiia bacterium]|nr:hypothetical protein [Acidimicrobiia bacterium]
MKRLLVLLGALALVAGVTAIALADDPAPVMLAAQTQDDAPPEDDEKVVDESGREKRSLLGDVLAELVEEGVLSEAQADAIEERLAEKKAECDDCRRHGFRWFKGPGHFGEGFEFPEGFELPEGFPFPEGFEFPEDFDGFQFRFPEGFEFPDDFDGFRFRLPEGFEFPEGFGLPEGFDFRGPIEIPEEVRDQLRDLMEQLETEFDAPFGRKFFHFPGGSLRDFLDDGELSETELEQLEAELRELAEDWMQRFEEKFNDLEA